MLKSARSPVRGYNHNVKYRGRVFHVQTEESGPGNPRIFTHLYFGGTILASKRHEYDPAAAPDIVRGLMQSQHKSILRDLKSGRHDAQLLQFFAARGEVLEPAQWPTRPPMMNSPTRRRPPRRRWSPQRLSRRRCPPQLPPLSPRSRRSHQHLRRQWPGSQRRCPYRAGCSSPSAETINPAGFAPAERRRRRGQPRASALGRSCRRGSFEQGDAGAGVDGAHGTHRESGQDAHPGGDGAGPATSAFASPTWCRRAATRCKRGQPRPRRRRARRWRRPRSPRLRMP